MGPKTFQQLVTVFGSPSDIFKANPGEIASLPRLSAEKEETIRAAGDNTDLIVGRVAEYQDRGIEMTTILEEDYPEMLLELDNPPPLLYWRGNLDIVGQNCVAVVGSHEASAEGIAEAVRLGKLISQTGTVVVSGLARGIDSGAHVGAIQAKGRTVAVLGCGFDNIYPRDNQALVDNILAEGLLLSEYRPETPVATGRLMARNRLIVGLARSVIVVEVTSGTGGTVAAISEAHNQAKSLFTCFDPNQDGVSTNNLGAIYLDGADAWKMVLRYMV
ncbi:MAG: DNA-protecting protein DprA [candidate division Zixibacteria bacterium]|nr:DNA-protecting protein DprA [candidate division Zixibacteria bacterium]